MKMKLSTRSNISLEVESHAQMLEGIYLRICLDFAEVGLLAANTRAVSSFFAAACESSSGARELEFVMDLDPI